MINLTILLIVSLLVSPVLWIFVLIIKHDNEKISADISEYKRYINVLKHDIGVLQKDVFLLENDVEKLKRNNEHNNS